MSDSPPGTPRYFATFTGYAPPLRPHNEIDYARAEASDAFSVFVFDAQGRVASFEKRLQHREPQPPSRLDGRQLPPGLHFFAPGAAGAAALGPALALDDTKGLAEYYRAQVGADGSVASLERVTRERTLRHVYTYWDNGRLREARYDADGTAATVERFDRDGKALPPD